MQNATLLRGRIALIERGLCTFQEKAARAMGAGAIGIIFANSEDELYQPTVGPLNRFSVLPCCNCVYFG